MEEGRTKRCSACRTMFPINHYLQNKDYKDSFTTVCKGCRKVKQKEYHAKRKEKGVKVEQDFLIYYGDEIYL